jgi:hypothetical protein
LIAEALGKLESTFVRGTPSPAEARLALLEVENDLTPLEFHQVAGTIRDRFANARADLDKLRLSELLATEAPARFLRRTFAPEVMLFHDPDISPANKRLVIAFCGKAQRLMMSKSVFLQLLRSTGCDVAILNDPKRNHFVDGSPDYAADFLKLVTRLDRDFDADRYKDVACYGTSMGGFVALRCGLLLGTRAISVGGRFPWRVKRMIDQDGKNTDAFELLCCCKATDTASFVCVYGERCVPDAAAVDHLATIFPVTRWPIEGVERHGVIAEMWKTGTLRQFYRDVFAFDGPALQAVPANGSPVEPPRS